MKQGVVVEKEFKQDFEPGSGSLYIPILGELFPKLFDHKMRAVNRWFVIAKIDDKLFRYEVDENLYNTIKVEDSITIGTDEFGMPKVVLS